MPTFLHLLSQNARRPAWRVPAACAVIVLAGCGKPAVVESPEGILVLGEFEESTTETRSLALGNRTLIIENENGAVSLTAGEGERLDLSFSIRARGDSREAAQTQLEKLLLEESGDEISYKIDIQPDKRELTNVDVTGQVPRDAELRLVLRSGNVTLTNLDGRIDVLLENGDITFLGGSRSVSVTTRNGDVVADFYQLSSGATAELSTTNGDVTLGLSTNSTAKVSASTRAGVVRTNGFAFSKPQLAARGAGARFSGSVGLEGGSVNMKTQNGDLIFRTNSLIPRPAPIPSSADSTGAQDGVAPLDGANPTNDSSNVPGIVPSDTVPAGANQVPPSGADDAGRTDAKSVERPDTLATTRPFQQRAADADSTGTGNL